MNGLAVYIVEKCELGGIRLIWRRECGNDNGHRVRIEPRDGKGAKEHGPFRQSEAKVRYEAMRAALQVAATQAKARPPGLRFSAYAR